MRFNTFLILIFFTINALSAGTYFKPPALIEGFTTVASAAGTTTLTRASQTKLIITGATTQTVVLPDATTMSTELGRRFYIINKSSGNVTVNASGGGLLTTLSTGTQAEIHLRAAGSAAGTWDVLSSSGGGGGTWGSITGTLSDQTDLQTALNLKAPLASPTFTGTITTPLVTDKALVTNGSGALAASGTSATQVGYLSNLSQDVQTSLDAKQARSTLTTAGDIYVATASATTTRLGPPALDGRQLVSDSAATNKIRYQAPMVDNFIKNGDAESVTPIVTYADAAATRPVDGTGGSPNVTTSISSSSPMFDSNSFTLVKDAANRQGQGWSIPFTIPAGQQAKVLQVEVPYIVVSGTFVAGTPTTDSDVIAYIYDVTNSTLIEPSSIKFLSNSTTLSDRLVTNFQSSATGTSYRLILHVATTSASAYTLRIDNVETKPSQYVYGTPITDWVAYTPTFKGATNQVAWTNATTTGFWRRVGDTLEGRATTTVSATLGGGSGELEWTIPPGLTIDTAKQNTGGNTQAIGSASMVRSGTAFYSGNVIYGSTTGVRAITNAGASAWTNGVPAAWSTNDTAGIIFKVPIVGWSSSTQVSDGYDARKVIFEARTNAGSIATSAATYVTLTWTTPTVDFVAGWNGSDTYTIRTADCYDIQVLANQNANAAAYLDVAYRINGGSEVLIGRGFGSGTAGGVVTGTATACLNAGDTVQARAQTEGTQGIGGLRHFTIKRSGGGTPTMSATELTQFYTYTGSPTGTLNGSYNTVTYGTGGTYYDTHGSYSAGVYTLRDQGCFDIKGSVQITHTTAAGFLDVGISFNDAAPFVADYKYVTGNVDTTQSISGSMCGKSGDNFRIKAKTNLTTPAYSSGAAYNYFIVSKRK